MLTNGQRAQFVEAHVALRGDGSLVRRHGHFIDKPITGQRFLVDGRQFETASVRQYLATGAWPSLSQRRKGGGYVTRVDRKLADDRLKALMIERPRAGVRELAATLGLSHPCVSRRIRLLKMAGLVDRVDGAWTIEEPVAARCRPWLQPLTIRQRGEDLSVARYG
jgi:hypothetical protein